MKTAFKAKIITSVFILLMTVCNVLSADSYYFWVQFKDKKNSPYSIYNASEYLSQRALIRRANYWLQPDSSDLPVNPSYVTGVAATGVTIHSRSKWMNGVTILTADSLLMNQVRALPFVSFAEYTGKKLSSQPSPRKKTKFDQESLFYGSATSQINQLHGEVLHDNRHTGKGIVIAILDAGFKNADINHAFDSLRLQNRLLGTRNFVSRNVSVYGEDQHGANVLSIMAGNLPGQYLGTAPDASYWLIQTEYAPSEYLYEVDCWVAGAEFADSVGADIINSSLGYTEFDDPAMNFTYADMNGTVCRASRAAAMAAQKGMLVCNSAGNSGNLAWKYIGSPADAAGIITVGAVTNTGIASTFTSYGPASDNRVKPEVCATGTATALVNTSGAIVYGNGTSFSCPVIAGLTACYLDFFISQTSMFTPSYVRTSLIRSASLYYAPTPQLGYGIPDFSEAIHSIPTQIITTQDTGNFRMFFIPSTKELLVNSANMVPGNNRIDIYSMDGKLLKYLQFGGREVQLNLIDLAPGIYIARMSDGQHTESLKIIIP